MKQTAFVSHYDCSRHDTGWGHPDHQGRLPGLMRAVYRDMPTLFDPLLEVEGRHASRDELELVHTGEHIDRVRGWAEEAATRGEVMEPVEGLRISSASWDAALAAAGSALVAADVVLEAEARNAFAAVRPEGHDALSDRPGHFSLFNNAAIAARYLRHVRSIDRVLVVECGFEAPTRIARLVADDPGIAVIGVYSGSRTELASPSQRRVSPSSAREGVVRELRLLLEQIHHPPSGFVITAIDFGGRGGQEGTHLDPLVCFQITALIRAFAERACGGRLVSILEGGYEPAPLGAAVVQHLRGLAGLDAA